MAKIGLWFYTNDGGREVRSRLVDMLGEKGHELVYDFDMRLCYAFNGRVYTDAGVDLSGMDVFYHMNADEQTPHQNEMLRTLEASGVRVVNSTNAFFLSRDKFFANQCLSANGVRVPQAALIGAENASELVERIMREMGRVVVKPRCAHGGKGVMKFDSSEALLDYVSATEHFFDNYYLERFIDFGTHDYRVEIFCGDVVGGYSRTRTHSFKTNVSAGGLMTPLKPAPEFERIAKKAAATLGVEVTIIDMVKESATGDIYILEVNPIMGIFVESAMRNCDKSAVREVDPMYANDGEKLARLTGYLDRLASAAAGRESL